jgi:hypothetical protein
MFSNCNIRGRHLADLAGIAIPSFATDGKTGKTTAIVDHMSGLLRRTKR